MWDGNTSMSGIFQGSSGFGRDYQGLEGSLSLLWFTGWSTMRQPVASCKPLVLPPSASDGPTHDPLLLLPGSAARRRRRARTTMRVTMRQRYIRGSLSTGGGAACSDFGGREEGGVRACVYVRVPSGLGTAWSSHDWSCPLPSPASCPPFLLPLSPSVRIRL